MYSYTQEDIRILQQHQKNVYTKIEMLDKKRKVIRQLEGIVQQGNYSIDANSDLRRTSSLTINLINNYLDINSSLFYTAILQIHVGFYDLKTKQVKYYPIGNYIFDSKNSSYDETTNSLSLNNVDLIAEYDSEHRGKLHSLSKLKIEAGTNMNDALAAVLKEIGITRFRLDTMGKYYDTELSTSQEVPYDLEFSIGSSYLDVIIKLRDLYPSWECFFDTDGVFVCQQIPTLESDSCVFSKDSNFIEKYLISESIDSTKLYDVKNIVEIWGKDIECDRFATSAIATLSGTELTYTIRVDNYVDNGTTDYINKSTIGFTCPRSNSDAEKVFIEIESYDTETETVTKLGKKQIYDFVKKEPISNTTFSAGEVYVLKYIVTSGYPSTFYYIGQFQIHAVSILTDHFPTAKEKQSFIEEFQTKNISYSVIPDSPYTIEKIGKITQVLSDGDYQNINDDSIALANAEYELWKAARLNDSINIECMLIPWLDVNQKVWYRKQNEKESYQYIIKSISGNLGEATMSMSLMRFYDLYKQN